MDDGPLEVHYTIRHVHFANVTKVVVAYSVLYGSVHGIYIQIALGKEVSVPPVLAIESRGEITRDRAPGCAPYIPR